MAANIELSRRQLFRVAAGAAVLAVPFFGERGRVSAQEAAPQQTEEKQIVIPKPEILEQHIEVFTSLLQGHMNPEALDALGLTPLLTEEELKKQHEAGLFTFENEEVPIENAHLSSVDYTLSLPDASNIFWANYSYDNQNEDALWQNIAFVNDRDKKLRKEGDKMPVPYDELQPNAYFFFKLPPGTPPDGMLWKDFSEITRDEKDKDIGMFGAWEKDTPLIEGIALQTQTNGFNGYTRFIGEPEKPEENKPAQQKMNRGLEMAQRGQKMAFERMNNRFNINPVIVNPGRLNIPQL